MDGKLVDEKVSVHSVWHGIAETHRTSVLQKDFEGSADICSLKVWYSRDTANDTALSQIPATAPPTRLAAQMGGHLRAGIPKITVSFPVQGQHIFLIFLICCSLLARIIHSFSNAKLLSVIMPAVAGLLIRLPLLQPFVTLPKSVSDAFGDGGAQERRARGQHIRPSAAAKMP